MDMNSIVIKLDRFGKNGKPDYSITIKGNEKVFYEGRANVETIGPAESIISEEDFMSLLADFKNSDFFSLNKEFIKDESEGYNVISITLPTEQGNTTTRKIRFNDKFEILPERLIYLSNLIDEMVNSSRWIEKQREEKPLKKSPKNKKKIIIIASIFVAAILIIAVFSTGFLDNQQNNTNQDQGSNNGGDNGDDTGGNNDNLGEQYFNPEIVFITTTDQSERQYNQRSPSKNTFLKGDTVYVDYEFQNVTHNSSYNITIGINVKYNGLDYYNTTKSLNNTAFSDNFYLIDSINTDDSWPSTSSEDPYLLNISINDRISNKSTNREAFFSLLDEDLPRVILTATPTTGNASLEVSFEAETKNFTGDIYTYLWYFGEGASDNTENPTNTHIYDNEGIYEAVLTVTDDESNMAYDKVTITVINGSNQSFNVSIDANPLSGSPPLDVTFTANTTGGNPPDNCEYQWDFDYDGSGTFTEEAEGKTLTHRFEAENYKSYWVFLRVVDNNNILATDYIFIPVIADS